VGVLQRFERRLEGLVEGAFAKVFRGEVQPVEIAAALQRETDDRKAIVSQGRVLVPNDFLVELSAHDHDRLGPYSQALTSELATMVEEHATERSYTFVGPVTVSFERAEDLDTGTFRVRSGVTAGVHVSGGVRETRDHADPHAFVDPTHVPPGPAPAAHLVISHGEKADVDSPRARGKDDVFPLPEGVVTIGRGTEADLRLDDPRVSRRHAEIRREDGVFVLTDLDSTNGTLVNDVPVSRRQLVHGDRIGIGTLTLLFRQQER
jgi:hypothetical protein